MIQLDDIENPINKNTFNAYEAADLSDANTLETNKNVACLLYQISLLAKQGKYSTAPIELILTDDEKRLLERKGFRLTVRISSEGDNYCYKVGW